MESLVTIAHHNRFGQNSTYYQLVNYFHQNAGIAIKLQSIVLHRPGDIAMIPIDGKGKRTVFFQENGK
ncbi:hypothetical protein HPE56_07160 [Maribacter sp. ANRC-HE7]|uniref:Uncharacterized protein n=1 Tax=Maribacter aquimaris TaxID=2737171 RepID=A0ABR7UZ47_9FLAO|nr:hypothetical protein [Maribacter aquimaris]MBD0777566.1 hypothetical protein [Maribacter aquimaris]